MASNLLYPSHGHGLVVPGKADDESSRGQPIHTIYPRLMATLVVELLTQ